MLDSFPSVKITAAMFHWVFKKGFHYFPWVINSTISQIAVPDFFFSFNKHAFRCAPSCLGGKNVSWNWFTIKYGLDMITKSYLSGFCHGFYSSPPLHGQWLKQNTTNWDTIGHPSGLSFLPSGEDCSFFTPGVLLIGVWKLQQKISITKLKRIRWAGEIWSSFSISIKNPKAMMTLECELG